MSTLKTNNIQHVDRSDPSIIINTDGSVNIAGTMTYEDVTNVDAVGIITGRSLINAQKQIHVGTGVSVKAGGINVTAGITTVQALQATSGTFSAAVSGTTGTFSAAVSGTTGTFSSDVSVGGNLSVDSGSNGMIDFGDITTAYGRLYADDSNGVLIGSKSNHQLVLRTNNTERARIDTSGRLLLGTTTEGFATADNFTISDTTTDCGMTIRAGTSSQSIIAFSDATSGAAEYAGYLSYYHSTDELHIGAVSKPIIKLHNEYFNIYADEGTTRLNFGFTDTNGGELSIYDDTGAQKTRICGSTGNNFFNNGGNFGIGTNNPAYTLDVVGDGGASFSASTNSTNGVLSVVGKNSAGGVSAISRIKSYPDGSSNQSHMAFETRNSSSTMVERLRIDSSGKLVLGTPTVNASDKFTVYDAGDAFASIRSDTEADDRYQVLDFAYGTGNRSSSNMTASIGAKTHSQSGGTLKADLAFSTNSGDSVTQKVVIKDTGNVEINDGDLIIKTAGHGISFSATSDGSGSATSELFDDYEEGSFTPSYPSGSGGSNMLNNAVYTNTTGYYTKIGSCVTFSLRIQCSSHTVIGGHVRILGLPYSQGPNNGKEGGAFFNYAQAVDTTNSGYRPTIHISNNQSILSFYGSSGNTFNAGAGGTNWNYTLHITGVYHTF